MQGVSETLARGNVKNIVVSMEDRMGGRKHLTHLSHVEGFGIDPDELAAVLQKKWSTSCSVNKLPGKTETGKMLDLQGNLLKVLPSGQCPPPPPSPACPVHTTCLWWQLQCAIQSPGGASL